MPDFAQLAGRYIAAWNETDSLARRALIEEIWSEDGRYIDPLAEATGRDQIDAVIAAAQEQFTGMTFRLAGRVDAHHDQARFTWELGPDGAAVVVGFDVAQRDADGRLALVLGFLDKVPSPLTPCPAGPRGYLAGSAPPAETAERTSHALHRNR